MPTPSKKLEEVYRPKLAYISYLFNKDLKEEVMKILWEYKDWFTWDYKKILGLERSLL